MTTTSTPVNGQGLRRAALCVTFMFVTAAVGTAAWADDSKVDDQPEIADSDAESRDEAPLKLKFEDAGDFKLDFEEANLRLNLGMLQDEGAPGDGEATVKTGTDPRDFSSKLMPYYLYTELENGIKVNQMNFFGMHAFTGRFAMTYDIPLAKKIDYSDLGAFRTLSGGIPSGSGFGEVPSGGVPFDYLDPDGDVIGLGDISLRFFLRPEQLEWSYDDGNTMGKKKGISLMPLVELLFPTATEDVLGGEAMIVSPGFVLVVDLPGDAPFGLGFFAMMNFFDFDVYKDDSRGSTSRWRGRWFWMQPLTRPGPALFDGLYLLTEFQPVYDFNTSDFDFWIGPEFGKAMEWGAIYAKPGWGIDTETEDRDFTFEVGFRYFF